MAMRNLSYYERRARKRRHRSTASSLVMNNGPNGQVSSGSGPDPSGGFAFILARPGFRFRASLRPLLIVTSIHFFPGVTFVGLTFFNNTIWLARRSFTALILFAARLTRFSLARRRALSINHGCREDHYQPRDADGQPPTQRLSACRSGYR